MKSIHVLFIQLPLGLGVSVTKLGTRNIVQPFLDYFLLCVDLFPLPHSNLPGRIRPHSFRTPIAHNRKHLLYILLHSIVTVYMWVTFEDSIFFMVVYSSLRPVSMQSKCSQLVLSESYQEKIVFIDSVDCSETH